MGPRRHCQERRNVQPRPGERKPSDFFGKKLNFSVDKVKKGVYIGFEKGKKPTLSIKSD
jgi:hypothetical protein